MCQSHRPSYPAGAARRELCPVQAVQTELNNCGASSLLRHGGTSVVLVAAAAVLVLIAAAVFVLILAVVVAAVVIAVVFIAYILNRQRGEGRLNRHGGLVAKASAS